jgi:type I restriction enzyme S subunit
MEDRKPYKLYSLAEWVNGMAFRDINFSPKGLPVIKIAEIKSGISSQTKFTASTYDSKYLIKKGDMLFCWSGQPETSIGTFWWQREDGWLNQHIFKVLPNENIVTRDFFYYVLQNLKPHFVEIARNKQTTGLGHVTKKDLERIDVLIPPCEEQKAIAKILSSLDNKIELNRGMNETLEAMARALFKAWFVDFEPVHANSENRPSESAPSDVVNLFPAEFENSIPKGWEVKKLGEVLEAKGGTTPSTKNFRFWGGENYWATPKDLSNLQFPVLLSTERRITNEGVKQISSGVLPKGTLLLSSRAPIGYLAISQVPVSINQGFIAIQAKNISNLFMLYWLMQNMETVKSRANGSTFQEISKSSFREVEMIVANSKILDLFEKKVEPLFEKIVSNEKENKRLEEIRDSLLPRLIAGKIPVSKIENEAKGENE